MSDHLPECFNTAHMTAVDAPCICDRLRACEERMLNDDIPAAAYHGQKGYQIGYDAGYIVGYGAATEDGWGEPEHIKKAISMAVQRVMELPDLSDAGFTYMNLLNRRTAIDAIRGES